LITQLYPPKQSEPEEDGIRYLFDDGECIGVMDDESGTKIVRDGDLVTLIAGDYKTINRKKSHTLFYCFMLISGWDSSEEKTI
jgi:hypothetical protein